MENTKHHRLTSFAETASEAPLQEPDRQYYFIEKAVHDMIVPLDTILIFNNADSCEGNGIWDYAKNFFTEEDMSFLAVVGDFSEEEIEAASEYCIVIRLPEKSTDSEA